MEGILFHKDKLPLASCGQLFGAVSFDWVVAGHFCYRLFYYLEPHSAAHDAAALIFRVDVVSTSGFFEELFRVP